MSAGQESTIAAASAAYSVIRDELMAHISRLSRCSSTAELLAHPAYRAIEPRVQAVLQAPDQGDFTVNPAPAKPAYRFVAWNLERGIQFDGQLAALRTHPYLKSCDVLLLTEADLGMARSENRAVARELARELGMHYAFAPCYLNLSKGAGLEHDAHGENELGLHGNAILSRYPVSNVRPIPLKNGRDKMLGREKRLGRQIALAADVEFPGYTLTAVSIHLDAQSTQRHRCEQMVEILDAIDDRDPVLLGGDWNTTTYNSSRAFHAIMGFWLRVLMGVDNVINNHYLHPDRLFEKGLFKSLEARGFDYKQSNRLGEHTTTYNVSDLRMHKNLNEWVPGWCFAFIRWALRNHGGRCPFKIDWFASRGVQCQNPVIVHEVREGREVPLSDHDAVGVDVVAPA